MSVEIELLSSFTDWHTGLVPGVVVDTAGDEVFEVAFELPLEPQPANANTVSASVAAAIRIERCDVSITSSFV